MDVLRDGKIKTRKDHKCHGCRNVIPAGTEVYSQTNTFDNIYTLYMCDECINWCKDKSCNLCPTREEAEPGYIRDCKVNGRW